ncbi:Methylthioribose-1-phosphate isomerase [Nymphon striatum]|nr:Methylthioribose-1-phosphate isomerase [Nymphon striatum]
MSLEAMKYTPGDLKILDQTLLPNQSVYIQIKNVDESWRAIKTLQVRGAPAIGIVGCLGFAVELRNKKDISNKKELNDFLIKKLDYLVTARPTAVHMKQSAEYFKTKSSKLCDDDGTPCDVMKTKLLKELEQVQEDDILMNEAIGLNGALEIQNTFPKKKVVVLTHCNAGALATGGYGTSIGVIRKLYENKCIEHVFCTETRPVGQGARLTAYELVYDKIPATLICDSMVAIAMERKNINVVVIGADRVAANGDTANKIGSLQLAILAKHFNIPFYIACSVSTIDKNCSTGSLIPIEERSQDEIKTIGGTYIAPKEINCWNPAFDVTPASLITGIITERGVYPPSELSKLL